MRRFFAPPAPYQAVTQHVMVTSKLANLFTRSQMMDDISTLIAHNYFSHAINVAIELCPNAIYFAGQVGVNRFDFVC